MNMNMSMKNNKNMKNQSNDGGVDDENGLRFSIRDCLLGELAGYLGRKKKKKQ